MNDQQLASALVRQQIVSRDIIQQAIALRKPEQSLAQVLLDMGAVTEDALQFTNGEVTPQLTTPTLSVPTTLHEEAATVRVVDAVLSQGVTQGASDIHVEPRDEGFFLRYRLDGVLRDPVSLDHSKQNAITSRLKVLANLDLAESRLPQDGRFRQTFGERIVDFRVSTLPTEHGEKVVLRILDTASVRIGVESLGMDEATRNQFEQFVRRPHGMILVTGPTGSGKSTTLYAALNRIKSERINIVTVEDPVEYRLSGINQTTVNPKIGLTFARQLRSILRQDPDVILVGEIRDHETAEMAFRAALTGHLVLSTLHTNDAASAVTRLVDIGIEPYLIVSSVIAVLAQRLVRVVCANCKQPCTLSDWERRRLGDISTDDWQPMRGGGCNTCGGTGFKGRVGLYELLPITEPIREAVMRGESAGQVRQLALQHGMRTLADDGLRKVRECITTMDEVERVVVASGDE